MYVEGSIVYPAGATGYAAGAPVNAAGTTVYAAGATMYAAGATVNAAGPSMNGRRASAYATDISTNRATSSVNSEAMPIRQAASRPCQGHSAMFRLRPRRPDTVLILGQFDRTVPRHRRPISVPNSPTPAEPIRRSLARRRPHGAPCGLGRETPTDTAGTAL